MEREKRKFKRKEVSLSTYVRKVTPDGNLNLMQFTTKDLSRGGIFITTEDLSLFDIGERVELLLDDSGERYYEGNARVVRGARVFTDEEERTVSGYGLSFFQPDKDFEKMLMRYIESEKDEED
ncbi:MAG: hypothetical protein DRP87_15295 [Spirochaetes bacterium]|nr:MAG: hypothetical protein DRP87_15295 [Spirochaetota bacterium]